MFMILELASSVSSSIGGTFPNSAVFFSLTWDVPLAERMRRDGERIVILLNLKSDCNLSRCLCELFLCKTRKLAL